MPAVQALGICVLPVPALHRNYRKIPGWVSRSYIGGSRCHVLHRMRPVLLLHPDGGNLPGAQRELAVLAALLDLPCGRRLVGLLLRDDLQQSAGD